LRGQFVRALQEYVRTRALAGPLVVVLEDLHWIDPSSLGLVEALLPLTAEIPLLVLLAARSFADGHVHEFAQRAFATTGARHQTIELLPLTRENSSELIDHLLQAHDRTGQIPLLVLDRAEGNPFFLEELLRGLLDAGRLSVGAGAPVTLPQEASEA